MHILSLLLLATHTHAKYKNDFKAGVFTIGFGDCFLETRNGKHPSPDFQHPSPDFHHQTSVTHLLV